MPDRPTPREMLARLVAFPTVSNRSNLDLIAFVEGYLAGRGVASTRIPDATGDKANLVARIGPDVEGGVVLSGHTDVVPTDGQEWASDPFELDERDGRLHGRGTCDMKGFCAIALAAVPDMLSADLKRPILLALSYDEEVGCFGAPPMIDAMLAAQPRPAAVIVGEPSMMRVVTGHKAGWGFTARVRGHEVHSSLIHTGVSAVMTAAEMIAWMNRTMAENATAAPGAFEPNYTTLHAGMISGGTANNITARDCTFSGEARIMPGESMDDWEARFRAEAARIEADMRKIHPNAAFSIETRMITPALAPEPGGAADVLVRGLTGDNDEHMVSYQTEAGQFQERGLSTVICGPGSIEQAHQPDEFLSCDQLEAGADFVRRLIRKLAS